MQGGGTGFLATLVWLYAVGVLVKADENMEGGTDAPQVRDAKIGDCVYFSGHVKRMKNRGGRSHW